MIIKKMLPDRLEIFNIFLVYLYLKKFTVSRETLYSIMIYI